MNYNNIMIDTVIFDLDGTLLNSIDDLADSMNFALAQNNFRQRTVEEIKGFVGEGVRKLVERALYPINAPYIVDEVQATFEQHYNQNKGNKTAPYDGILQLISDVVLLGFRVAIVTNKYDKAAQEIAAKFFSNIYVVIGEREGLPKKPAPDMVNLALEALETKKENAVYVGDSEIDILTAANSGVMLVCVSWGFREKELLRKLGATCIIDSPSELLPLII